MSFKGILCQNPENPGSLTRSQEEGTVLAAIEWVKDSVPRYFAQEVEASVSGYEQRLIAAVRKPKGFMKEWCSFASLYKDSYISGPNRFEVIMALAQNRGLNITGMAIAGKPGGLVCEGEEGDVVEFVLVLSPQGFKVVKKCIHSVLPHMG